MAAPLSTQLQMFMTGSELQRSITTSLDRRGDEDMGGMWARKERQSKAPAGAQTPGAGVYDSVRDSGWNPPARGTEALLTMYHFNDEPGVDQREISDGHHRVAAAAAVERATGNPVYVPLRHQGF